MTKRSSRKTAPESTKSPKELARRESLLRTMSLADDKSPLQTLVFVVFALGGMAGPMIVALKTWPRYARELWFIGTEVVVGIAIFAAMLTLASWTVATAAKARLRRIGWGFDAARFLKDLGTRRRESVLEVKVTFADAGETEPLEGQAIEWLGEENADGPFEATAGKGRLTIAALKLQTHRMVLARKSRGQRYFFDNQPVQRQLRRIVKVLPRLDRMRAIESIDVTVKGIVVPLDAEP